MVFGEIIEPTTRALLYEEDDYVTEINVDWKVNCDVPNTINALLIAETNFTNKIIEACLLNKKIPVAQTSAKIISIYKYEQEDMYIALCNIPPASAISISIGQVTEMLLPWIKAAKKCYSLITLPTASYQNKHMMEKPSCLLRMLSNTKNNAQLCPILETPNLITGIGANCLSYCVFVNQDCSLFVGYIDYAPIDSVNSKPFIDLLKNIGFDSHGKIYKLVDELPENNLYI